MNTNNHIPNFENYLRRRPDAYAAVRGSRDYPQINGAVRFYATPYGTVVVTEVVGLPKGYTFCASPIFAFHIHEGESCISEENSPFSKVGMHYDPRNCPHPYHAGDMPPLFSADGYAFSAFITDRFSVEDIVGRTVIIHSSPDDFTTQPSGNAGTKIACGEIQGRARR